MEQVKKGQKEAMRSCTSDYCCFLAKTLWMVVMEVERKKLLFVMMCGVWRFHISYKGNQLTRSLGWGGFNW